MKFALLALAAVSILFLTVSIASTKHLRSENELLAAPQANGTNGSNYTIVQTLAIGFNVSGPMLQYTSNMVVNVSNTFNLTGNNSLVVANQIRRNMERQYNMSFGAFVGVYNKAYAYFPYDLGIIMSWIVSNHNSTNSSSTFIIDVYCENLYKPNITNNTNSSMMRLPAPASHNLAATYIRTISQGPGINEQMKNNLINIAIFAANAQFLTTTGGICFHCFETAQVTSVNAGYTYRYGFSVSVSMYDGSSYTSGLSASALDGDYLEIVLASGNSQFIFDIIATRPNF